MILRLAVVLFLFLARADAATCKGEDPCKACHDCSRCQFCAVQKKGSCGVCRNQTNAQRAAAKAKAKTK